ncbi:uncharacterized protein LTR77_002146 [Saxophila tyrrhenica]|uniref:CFEM domain-containing protein n=1 Tax=Saxophila tyrrhenica TaxID=1690608 RepID=A0AAV9PID1_9PEZI|nr:hypothetical protein LTR77_002146 [Saxophila tyrrhenica]
MYTYIAALALLASSVLAQNPGIPTCAFDCVTGYGGCGQFDYQCICSNQDYIAQMACCVSKNCDKADQDSTLEFANALCAGQDVNNLPQTATCASTASSASSTSGSTASTSTASNTGSTVAGGTTNAPAPVRTIDAADDSASSTSAAAASSSSGAAARHNVEGVGIGMVVAGLVAAL